jgi:hypothetical protein
VFDVARNDFSREHIFIVEIDMDYCALDYGVYPCAADGLIKCYNTLASCQDPNNFETTVKTYRFSSRRSPHPAGIESIPNVADISFTPSQIDLTGGLGVRASVSINFLDHPFSDIGVDPYLDERTYIASDRGTFWTKWRARNPYYTGRPIRVYTGYLVNGLYDEDNFAARHYVIESLQVSGGQCRIVAKDPLKLADNNRALAPKQSTGQLQGALSTGSTHLTLEPAGVGDLEYPASGYIRIRSEVIEFSRTGDVMSMLNRGEFNTVHAAHSAGDTVQLCLHYDAESLNDIIYDLLVNYADVDPAFIPTDEWASEVGDFLPGLLSTLITEPTGVQALLKELGEQAPHSLYWDERTQKIVMKAIKPPPITFQPLTQTNDLITLSSADRADLRVSTVVVNFGQFDPTKRLDQLDNYVQSYVRFDADSAVRYGSNRIKRIFSRWITSLNKAAAVVLAAKIGRRFADIPRECDFLVDPKNINVWTGDSVTIQHREIVDFSGALISTPFQIVSVAEKKDQYQYSAIEYNYADPLGEDPPEGVSLIIFGGDTNSINIRSVYNSLFPEPDEYTEVKVIIEADVVIGSTTNTVPALQTGTWPAGMIPIVIENRGSLLGRGGDGGDDTGSNGMDGGDALEIDHDIELNNIGLIGAGGGGGGGAYSSMGSLIVGAQAGGGAGRINGSGFVNGTDSTGGEGQYAQIISGGVEPMEVFAIGGWGGNLGEDGEDGAGFTVSGNKGLAGLAIKCNGNTVSYIESGTIIGDIEA